MDQFSYIDSDKVPKEQLECLYYTEKGSTIPSPFYPGVAPSCDDTGLSAIRLLPRADGKLIETASCPWKLMLTLVSASTASPFNS